MEADPTSLAESLCLPFLRKAQNADGGWGFHPGSESRTEATCWALLALIELAQGDDSEAIRRGFRFLRAEQLPDGSWPSTPGEQTGCWVTSLASWVLLADPDSPKPVAAGLDWVCKDWPRDGRLWGRLLTRLSSDRHLSPMNTAYRGWGWTPGTASWVEPTAFALLTLQRCPEELVPRMARQRLALGEAMLRDRMCPGGGWNCGNPRVYGVAGEALVIPTVWALLALRQHPEKTENSLSLAWLEGYVPYISGTGSLALAQICLASYGRKWPAGAPDLHDFISRNEPSPNVQVMAWASFASSTKHDWLATRAKAAF
jgi:Prenyltransferase and squalene oxidase repeat